MMKSVAIVLGTYNRIACLQRAIASIRAAVGAHPYLIIVSDGGSTDGTLAYLASCEDVHVCHGGLDGAVKAFNLGFEYAVQCEYDYVMHLNDDAEIVCPGFGPGHMVTTPPIAHAIQIMETGGNERIGEVAFAFDLRGDWGWEKINGAPYANFGVIRREAGIEVAKTWDPGGTQWWNPIYRTYGADCELGARMWQLGWHVYPVASLRVHDMNAQDELRTVNNEGQKNGDSELFWSRWREVDLLQHVPRYIELQLELALQHRRIPQPHHRPAPMRRTTAPNPEYKK